MSCCLVCRRLCPEGEEESATDVCGLGDNVAGLLTPFQKVAPCSSAVFITLAAAGWSRPFHGIERPTVLVSVWLCLHVYTSWYGEHETHS